MDVVLKPWPTEERGWLLSCSPAMFDPQAQKSHWMKILFVQKTKLISIVSNVTLYAHQTEADSYLLYRSNLDLQSQSHNVCR